MSGELTSHWHKGQQVPDGYQGVKVNRIVTSTQPETSPTVEESVIGKNEMSEDGKNQRFFMNWSVKCRAETVVKS